MDKKLLSMDEVLKKVEEKPEILKHLSEPHRRLIDGLRRQKQKGYCGKKPGGSRKASPTP